MPLKYQIDSLEGLDEATQALYTEKDGKYVLKVEGMPEPEDTSGLKRKVEELLEESKTAKEAKRRAEEEAERAREEKARKDGDYKTLAEQYEGKLKEWETRYEQERKERAKDAVNREAMRLAASLSEGPNAEILSEFISRRMRYEDGKVKVTDAEGNLTISSLDDLQAEFRNDQRFAALVTGTKGSGSGAAGQGGGAPQKQLKDMSEQERVALYKQDPDKFNQLKKEAQQQP